MQNIVKKLKGVAHVWVVAKSLITKKKNHPGNFPENTLVERHTTEAQEDEELLVTQEAFKNRIEDNE